MSSRDTSRHYDQEYFAWQRRQGEFGGWANLTKFEEYVRPDDAVLDFGCGGGFLLKSLKCAKRVGVELNPAARAVAVENGVEVYARSQDVPDSTTVDVIVTDNALEHTASPLEELKALYDKLRPGGKIVVVVPCEGVSMTYKRHDLHHHLFTWSPSSLGNLLSEAGFEVTESKPYIHKWPPKPMVVARLGHTAFDLICGLYGRIARSWFQVRAVGVKRSGEGEAKRPA